MGRSILAQEAAWHRTGGGPSRVLHFSRTRRYSSCLVCAGQRESLDGKLGEWPSLDELDPDQIALLPGDLAGPAWRGAVEFQMELRLDELGVFDPQPRAAFRDVDD